MVVLFSPTKFNQLNIDTLERAITISGMVLQAAIFQYQADTIAKNEKVDNSIFTQLTSKIQLKLPSSGKEGTHLQIKANLPYDPSIFAQQGGFSLAAIKGLIQTYFGLPEQYGFTGIEFNFATTPSNPVEPALPTPNYQFLDSFEKYYLYHVMLLRASVTENRNSIVTVDFNNVVLAAPEIRTTVNLSLDTVALNRGDNLIQVVQRVVDSYASPTIDFDAFNNIVSLLDDSVLLGDEILFSD